MVALDVQKMLYLLVVEQVASSSVQCYVTEIFVCWFALTFSKSLARHLRVWERSEQYGASASLNFIRR